VCAADFTTGHLTLRFAPPPSDSPFPGEKVYRALHIEIDTAFVILKGIDLPGSADVKMPPPVVTDLTAAGFYGAVGAFLQAGEAFLDPAAALPGSTEPTRGELHPVAVNIVAT